MSIILTTLASFVTAFLGCFAAILKDDDIKAMSFAAFGSSNNKHGLHCWLPEIPEISNSSSEIYDDIKTTLGKAKYQAESIARFQRAIGFDTQANDDFGNVGDDERWSKFYQFSAYLLKEFPLVHKNLQLETINRHGLLYTWEPSSEKIEETLSSKPFLLLAHQDTVPVSNESLADWKFDPFAGHIDGDGIMYGRGVHDDKNSLISILEGIELLLQNDFKPSRTELLALGFDEEVSGRRGALEISKFLEQKYGKIPLNLFLTKDPE